MPQSWLRNVVRVQLLMLVACALGAVALRADEVIDRVAAVVAGDIILMSDVRAARELGLVETDRGDDPDRAALTRLIDRALMLAEVDRYAPPMPAEETVTEALEAVRGRAASPQAFTAALARAGLEEMRLREILRENLRIEAYVSQRFPADTGSRQRELIDEWVGGLRRRAEIVDLFAPR
jgi:hypothetical protein